MAAAVQLTPEATPGFTHAGALGKSSAKKASDFLNTNHTSFHTRWKATFHNHITHHMLALWALGASPAEMQEMWDYNLPCQAPIESEEAKAAPRKDLRDPAVFKQCLGDNSCYADFLRFFENEISQKGVSDTVQKYLFNNDETSNDIFGRMFSDLLHPAISLGCGLEFNQPSIVAEALAGSSIHETWPSTFLQPTEDYIAANPDFPRRPFLEILDNLRGNDAIRTGVKHTDGFNKVVDGLFTRVPPAQLAPFLSQFQIGADATSNDLHRHMADLMYSCAYMIGAAQQPGKREAIDFVTLHTVTMCAFYPAILKLDWLPNRHKARLMEAGARTSAVMYAGCGSPELFPRRILDYKPRRPDDGWPELFRRAIVYKDEGHATKLMRALYTTEQLGDPAPGFPIAKADLLKIAHMGMDSIELAFDDAQGNGVPASSKALMDRLGPSGVMVVNNMTRWVYYGGLEKAWDHVPDQDTQA